jgi:hypothetical protein
VNNKLNSHEVFGKPTVAQSESQLYYDRYQDRDVAIFKRDARWFSTHPRQQRYIRPALGNEFNCDTEHLDYFGTRVAPPKLWVSVERMLGGQKHRVLPVYRGSCFWEVDDKLSMLTNDENDAAGNMECDVLLHQFHLNNGVHPFEMMKHAEKIAEVLHAMSISVEDGLVN